MASRTTTSTPKSSNASTLSKSKANLKKLFKCWRKKPPADLPKAYSDSSIAPADDSKVQDKALSTGDIQKIPVKDAGTQESKNKKSKKGSSSRLSRKGKSKDSSKADIKEVCQKCCKRKQDKNAPQHKKDKPSCKCKSRGYCNTNTIIFPSDCKLPPSFQSQENKYLELLKEIIKDETRKSCTDMTEFRREMDRQREEIRELKSLVLQSLLNNANNNCGGNNKDQTNKTDIDEKSQSDKHLNKRHNFKTRTNSESTLHGNKHAGIQTSNARSESRESLDKSIISKTTGKSVSKKNKKYPQKKGFFTTWLSGDY